MAVTAMTGPKLIAQLSLGLLLSFPAAAMAAPPIAAISQAALLTRLQHRDLVVVDVRSAQEFAAGHIAGAINIPHDQLPNRASELPQDRNLEIALYCRSGRRSAQALDWLAAQGYQRLLHIEGDFLAWQAAGQPVVVEPVVANPL
jgi:phage shock protein E